MGPTVSSSTPKIFGVYHVKNPNLPQFRFEWHPETKKVFIIRLGSTPLVGDPLAHDIENPGAAINAVLIWSRGYREAKSELNLTGGGDVNREN